MAYRIEDSSGDVVVQSDHEDAGGALVDLARGIADLQTGGSSVRRRQERTVEVTGRDAAALLVAFANDVIYAFEADGFLVAGGELEYQNDAASKRVRGVLHGEAFDRDRHESGVEVKAATFHDLRFDHDDDRWHLRLLLDL